MLSPDAATTVGARRAARNAAARHVCVRGLRYVVPYETVSVHWIKDRHDGCSLAAVCTDMFGSHESRGSEPEDSRDESAPLTSLKYWTREIDSGRVLLKHKRMRQDDPLPCFARVPPETPVERQWQVKILRHVHERVTSAALPEVLFEDAHMIVVDKPSGVPTQDDVDGSTSVACILQRMRPELTTLRPAHRLDLGVSGALVLAKGSSAARRLMQAFAERRVVKVYVARIRGTLVQPPPPPRRLKEDGGSTVADCCGSTEADRGSMAVDGGSMAVDGGSTADGGGGGMMVVSTAQVFSRGRAVVVADDAPGAKPCRTDVHHLTCCGDGTSLVECHLHSGASPPPLPPPPRLLLSFSLSVLLVVLSVGTAAALLLLTVYVCVCAASTRRARIYQHAPYPLLRRPPTSNPLPPRVHRSPNRQ